MMGNETQLNCCDCCNIYKTIDGIAITIIICFYYYWNFLANNFQLKIIFKLGIFFIITSFLLHMTALSGLISGIGYYVEVSSQGFTWGYKQR